MPSRNPRESADQPQSLVAETHRCDSDPLIARFRSALTKIQVSELERLYRRLPSLDEHAREQIGQFADCLVATVLRPPLEVLQDESLCSTSHGLESALQRLFQL